ncbi:MAG: molybdopterin-dependent oxidoreductase [Chloroflexi bacterium]|nr:molybdopterin-dependent oxidoreductase [Chloroflexota bacterium]
MRVTRRNFLKAAAISAGSVAFAGCAIPEKELLVQSPVRPPEDLLTSFEAWYATTSHQCPSGCSMIVRVVEGRAKKAEGNPDHPINRGKLCVRCQASVQAVYHPDRIRTPLRRTGERGSGQFQPISWDEAYGEVAAKLREAQGRNALALLTDPQRGLEGVLLRRFAEALGGEALAFEAMEHTVLRTAVQQVFGQDRLPDFDIENARYILSFGADFLHTWLSPVQYSWEYGEFRQGRRERGTLVQIEPQRLSATGASADEWVPVKPGSEGILALSMAQVIISERLHRDEATAQELNRNNALNAYRPEQVAELTGVSAERITELAHAFANNQPALALPGAALAGHANGLQNVRAVLALNRLVGNVGRPGGVRFNPAPPLEALATSPLRVGNLNDWIRMVNRMAASTKPVQVAMIAGANPVYGLPAVVNLRGALLNVPFVVSFSTMLDETTALADLILPSHHALESWGLEAPDPGPGYPVISLQQPVINPRFDTRALGDSLLKLAGDLGGAARQALPWATTRDLLREHAQQLFQSVQTPTGTRGSVRATDFESFWVGMLQRGGWWDTTTTAGAAATLPALTPPPAPQQPAFDGNAQGTYPLVVFESNALGTGEGAHLPWLQAVPDPITSISWQAWVELHPQTARQLGVDTGDIVALESSVGVVEGPVYVNPAIGPEVVAMPTGQGHSAYGRFAAGRGSNVLAALAPVVDTETGALAWSATRVRLRKTGRHYQLATYEGDVPPVVTEELGIYPLSKA